MSTTQFSVCNFTTDSFLSLAVCLATPTLLGRLAGWHVRLFKDVYHNYTVKPSFIPPNWLFRPIWTVFYLTMGLSSYLVYQTDSKLAGFTVSALAYYATQLLLNLCWPALFFRYRNYKVSLYVITLNLFAAITTAYKFYYINSFAAVLLTPYIAWLAFSGYVNKRIWRLNEDNKKLRAINNSGYNKFIVSNPLDIQANNLCENCMKQKEN
ncbi:hypothetical protein K502DRAFT_322511 [Neoconidiobolus thromboides FSU 785]|nr:hypothetical protein K502DRAFT_322511 [Neoconidiobolus thromboides FSU 785]